MVESQTANLTLGPFFGHDLCFRCPNGWCEPILGIYVLRAFQWYKELLKPTILQEFWPLQSPSEDSKVHQDSISQSGSCLGSVRVHSLTLSFTPMLPFRPTTLPTLALVASPKRGLRQTRFYKMWRQSWSQYWALLKYQWQNIECS